MDLTFLDQPISLLQDNASMHVGTSVWEASLAIARWLESHVDDEESPLSYKAVCGKRVIELGAGCGLAGAWAYVCVVEDGGGGA